MSGMKTIQHNVLDPNHYLVGSRTHKHGTPKILYQLAKMQPLCHQFTLLRVSEIHINQIINDRQNLSQPGILRHTLGTSRATLAHRQVVKNQLQFSPLPSGREKHRPPSSRHSENILAGKFAHMSFHPLPNTELLYAHELRSNTMMSGVAFVRANHQTYLQRWSE